MGSLAEVQEFDAHQLTITVPNTEWWLGTLNAEQVKINEIYIFIKKEQAARSISDKVDFYSCVVSSLHDYIHLIDGDDSLFSESERCLLVIPSHTIMKLYQSNYSLHSYRKYFKHNHRHLCTWQHFGFSGRTPFPTEKIKLLWTIKAKEYQNKKMKYKLMSKNEQNTKQSDHWGEKLHQFPFAFKLMCRPCCKVLNENFM